MGVTALVMVGGKGSHMVLCEEKPLLKVGGKSMIEHVLEALKEAKKIDRSGITSALSWSCREASLKALEIASENRVMISFDTNIRLRLWTKERAHETLLPMIRAATEAGRVKNRLSKCPSRTLLEQATPSQQASYPALCAV